MPYKKISLFFSIVFMSVVFCGCAEVMKTINTSAKTWTFMVCIGGNNNLETDLINNIKDMEKVGSDSNVNIVIHADFPTYALRGLVEKNTTGSTEIISNFTRIPTFDATSAESVANFVQYCKNNYPASRYMLVLSSHGNGWRDKGPVNVRGIMYDDNSGNTMTMPQYKSALISCESILGKKIDIIAFDACLMGMLEIGYQAKDYADYMVASEDSEPGVGWPYNTILASLESNSGWSAADFASDIVNKYYESMNNSSRSVDSTMSAVDLSKLGPICSALISLEAIFPASRYVDLQNLRDQKTGGSYTIQAYTLSYYRDLYDFASKISSNFTSVSGLSDVCASIEAAVLSAVINHKESGASNLSSYGLSIYFPSATDYFSSYEDLDFSGAQASGWASFIKAVNANESALTYVDADFKAMITWEGNADFDLVCTEYHGSAATAYSAYASTVTPNGNFTLDSYVSGINLEYFQSLSSVEPIEYWFLISCYSVEAQGSADVYLSTYKDNVLQSTYRASELRGSNMRTDDLWTVAYYGANAVPNGWHESPTITSESIARGKSLLFGAVRQLQKGKK